MKRNTWKKTVAFVMALTLVAGTMPANVGGFLTGGKGIVAKAAPDSNQGAILGTTALSSGQFYVNGVDVATDPLPNGCSFDADSNTLTLNGANITQCGKGCGIYYEGNSPFNIVLVGDNTIDITSANGDAGIHANSLINISGTGKLTVKGTDQGIAGGNGVNFNGGTVDVEAKYFAVNGAKDGEGGKGNIIIGNATVTATVTEYIALYGYVINSIAGKGWTDAEGTADETAIEVSTTGHGLMSYRKVQFLAENASDERLNGSGTEDDPYLIGSLDDLNEYVKNDAYTDKVTLDDGSKTTYIKLTQDFDINDNYSITKNTNIDLQSYKLRSNYQGTELKIDNNAIVAVNGDDTGYLWYGGYALSVNNNCKLIVNSGHLGYILNSGNVIINGGIISGLYGSGSYTINGGSFNRYSGYSAGTKTIIDANINSNTHEVVEDGNYYVVREKTTKITKDDGITVTKGGEPLTGDALNNVSGEVTFTAAKPFAVKVGDGQQQLATFENNTYTLTTSITANATAEIVAVELTKYTGTVELTYYPTLAEAVAAATNDSEIRLLDNIELSQTIESKDGSRLRICLDGHNVTATNARAFWIKSGSWYFCGNGTISSVHTDGDTTFADTSSVIRVGDAAENDAIAEIRIEGDVTVSSPYCYGVTVFGKNKETTEGPGIRAFIYGKVHVTGNQSAISGNGSNGLSPTFIGVDNGAEIVAENAVAIYHPQAGKLNIENATVSGTGGIEAKAGVSEVQFIHSFIEATGQPTHEHNNNGTSTSGYAIAAVENKAYAGSPTINIKDGGIVGKVAVVADDTDVAEEKKAAINIRGGVFTIDPTTENGVKLDEGYLVELSGTQNSPEAPTANIPAYKYAVIPKSNVGIYSFEESKVYDGRGVQLNADIPQYVYAPVKKTHGSESHITTIPFNIAYTYKWQKKNNDNTYTDIQGATDTSYTTGANVSDSGTYRFVATNNGNELTAEKEVSITHGTPEIITTVGLQYDGTDKQLIQSVTGDTTDLYLRAVKVSDGSQETKVTGWIKYDTTNDGSIQTSLASFKAKDVGIYKIYYYYGETAPSDTVDGVLSNSSSQIAPGVLSANNFTFTAPDSDSLTYDGNAKSATVQAKVGVEGIGTIHVKYSSDNGTTWSDTAPKNAGTYKVGITVDAGDNYMASDDVLTANDWTFMIAPATPQVSDFNFAPPTDLIYNGSTKTATVVPASGVNGMGGIAVKYSSDNGQTWSDQVPVNAGTYLVGITVDQGDNYNATSTVLHSNDWNFVITRATAQVSDFNFAPPTDLTDNGNAKTATVEPKSGLNGMGNVTIKYYADERRTDEIPASDVKTVGTYYVGITVAEGSNYKATETNKVLYDNDWSFSIGAATPTITLAQGWTYNGEMKQLISSVAYGGATDLYLRVVKENDESPVAWVKYENAESLAQDAFKRADAGTYHVFYYVGKTEPTINDRGTLVDDIVEIGKARFAEGEITATNFTGTYDGQAHTITVNVPVGATVKYSHINNEGFSEGYEDNKIYRTDAGETTVYYIVQMANYMPYFGSATITINKANLTVTAKPKTITYGDAPANDGVEYSGFVNGEGVGDLGGTLEYEFNYARYGDVGGYTITPKGLTSSNYDITFVHGTLTVKQKEIGINWSDTSLTYDGSEQKPGATATGLENGDVVGITVTGGQTNAGENYTATASGLNGEKAGNYKLPTEKTTQFTINRAASTVSQGPTANTGLTYNGSALDLITAGEVNGGTMQYAVCRKVTKGGGIHLDSIAVGDVFVPTDIDGIYLPAEYKKLIFDDTTFDVNNTIGINLFLNDSKYNLNIGVNSFSLNEGYNGVRVTAINEETKTVTLEAIKYDESNPTNGLEWKPAVPQRTDAGTYYVYYKVVGDENHNDIEPTLIGEINIAKATPTITITPTTDSLVCDGSAKSLATVSDTSSCVQYKYAVTASNVNSAPTADAEWFDTLPTKTDAGTYKIWYKSVENANYNAITPTAFNQTVTINRGIATVTNAPTAKDLTYNKEAQFLVTAGTAANGTMNYAVTLKTQDNAPINGWETTIPQETNVGNYRVWYKAVATDTANYNDSTPAYVDVEIKKASALTTPPTAKNPTHYSSAVQLINAGEVEEGCTIEYQLGNNATDAPTGTWETDATKITANSSGTFYVWYKVTGTENYESVDATPITVKVSQGSTYSSQTWTLTMDSYEYDGTAHVPTIVGKVHTYANTEVEYTYFNTVTGKELSAAPSEPGKYKVKVFADGGTTHYTRTQWAVYSILEAVSENGQANPAAFKESGVIPGSDGKLFAGWFADSARTTAYTGETDKAYAKFIDAKVLTVKAQIASNTTADSEKTSIRFITSVDSLKYQNVGFKITFNGKTTDQKMTKVYSTINAGGAKVKPTVFSEDSQYMEAFALNNIPNNAFDKEFTVTPYYTTLDGTIVEGETKTFTIANMIK